MLLFTMKLINIHHSLVIGIMKRTKYSNQMIPFLSYNIFICFYRTRSNPLSWGQLGNFVRRNFLSSDFPYYSLLLNPLFPSTHSRKYPVSIGIVLKLSLSLHRRYWILKLHYGLSNSHYNATIVGHNLGILH